MTLQGPHHVAKKSINTALFLPMTSWKVSSLVRIKTVLVYCQNLRSVALLASG